jgi:type III secretion protein J
MMTVTSLIRFTLTMLLALLVVACGNRVELMASMPEGEANEVMAALQNAGFEAQKIPGKDGNVGVTLEASQMGRAVDLLRAKGLPRERFAGMGEVFRKEGLISSPLEERARYLYALSQELGATLTQIDGVVVARVHVVLPERGSPGDPNTPSSAAVFIKHQAAYNLDTVLPQVRRLVTNSIPSLASENVSIVLVSAVGPDAGISVPGAAAAQGVNATGAQATSGVPMPAVIAGALLLLVSLGVSGFLAWKFWLPARAARLSALKAG